MDYTFYSFCITTNADKSETNQTITTSQNLRNAERDMLAVLAIDLLDNGFVLQQAHYHGPTETNPLEPGQALRMIQIYNHETKVSKHYEVRRKSW